MTPLELALVAVFLFGTGLLWRTSHERHSIIFLIRTRHFLAVIESLAAAAPRLWRFLADCAIVFSFGGLGAAYVAKFSRDRGNLPLIVFLLGFAAAYVHRADALMFFGLLAAAGLIAGFARRSSTLNAGAVSAFVLAAVAGIGLPVSLISAATAVAGVPAFLLITLSAHGYQIIMAQTDVPGISPALPATTEEGELVITFPGTGINLPILYFLVVIAVTMVAHELAHGILARVHGLKVKSTGLLTAGILPIGAFVEPDEEALMKRDSVTRMHLFSAGSFANILVAAASLLFMSYVLVPVASSITYVDGMEVVGFDASGDYPAEEHLAEGDVIRELNGVLLESTQDFYEAARTLEVGGPVDMVVDGESVSFSAARHPENDSRAYMGVVVNEHYRFHEPYDSMAWLKTLLGVITITTTWMLFINLSISLVNLLPIVPFDGGKMLAELLGIFSVSAETTARVSRGIIVYIIVLLFVNVSPLLQSLSDWIVGIII